MINGIGNGIGFGRTRGTGGAAPIRPIASPASIVNPTAFQANWQIFPGAISYELDVSTELYFGSYVYQNISTVDTFYGVVGLTSGTTYYYRVKAILSGGGVSLYSNTISVTTT